MKKYLIEFTMGDGSTEEVEFKTDRTLEWTIRQWCRNRHVVEHKLISETSIPSKQMLLD